MARAPARSLRLTLCALAVLALALAGVAHRAPDAGLERFLAAGGDIAAICAGGDGPAPHHRDDGPCAACRLIDAALAVPPAAVSHLPHVVAAAESPHPRSLASGGPRQAAHRPRAPPRV